MSLIGKDNFPIIGPATFGGGTGDISSLSNIADNAIVKGDGGGKAIQSSGLSINDSNTLDMNSNSIINLGSPSGNNDAVTKGYVDNLIEGVKWKNPADLATTGNITLSGEQTIDGVLTSSSRVLVKNQTTATENGLYVTSAGAWTRSSDTNTGTEIQGMAINILSGSTNADVMFVNTDNTITIGVTNITFVNLGSSIAHNNTTGIQGGTTSEYYHLTNQQYTDTTSLTTTEYAQLANINSTAISSTQWGYLGALNQNLTTSSNVTFGNIAGTLTTASQTNITSIGNLTGLTVVGVGDFQSGNISLTIGADTGLTTRTNNTDKTSRLASAHYTNTEEPLALIIGTSTNSLGVVSIGGGSTSLNSATEIRFYTAGTSTTTTGTERMRLDNAGNLGIGLTTPTKQLEISSSTTSSTFRLSRSGTIIDNDVLGIIDFRQVGLGTYGEIKGIVIDETGGTLDGALAFSVQSNNTLTETLRLVSGQALIGSSTADGINALQVTGAIKSSGYIFATGKNTTTWGSVGGTFIDYTSGSGYGRVGAYDYGTAQWKPLIINYGGRTIVGESLADNTVDTLQVIGSLYVNAGTSSGSLLKAGEFLNLGTSTAGTGAYIFIGSPSNLRGTHIGAINTTGSTNGHDLYFSTSSASATPTERARITTGGRFLLATTTDDGIYRIQSIGGAKLQTGSGFALLMGADTNATTLTDATAKFLRVGIPHYLNAEEPVSILTCSSDASTNTIIIGGGTSGGNSATEIRFYTAATLASTTGLERMKITSKGNVLIGGTTEITTGTQALGIFTGTAPTAVATDSIAIYSSDVSAGNTTISLWTEGTPITSISPTSPNRTLAVRINGTLYYLHAKTTND